MTTNQTRLVLSFDISFQDHLFNGLDEKGRCIGAQIKIWSALYEDTTEWVDSSNCPAGTSYFARVSATRGGEKFGALQHANRFDTETERDAYVAKYLANATKRNDAKLRKARALADAEFRAGFAVDHP